MSATCATRAEIYCVLRLVQGGLWFWLWNHKAYAPASSLAFFFLFSFAFATLYNQEGIKMAFMSMPSVLETCLFILGICPIFDCSWSAYSRRLSKIFEEIISSPFFTLPCSKTGIEVNSQISHYNAYWRLWLRLVHWCWNSVTFQGTIKKLSMSRIKYKDAIVIENILCSPHIKQPHSS